MRLIGSADCERETGFDAVDLLSLTGVFGIHEPQEFMALYQAGDLMFRFFFDDNDALNVEIANSPAIDTLKIVINYPNPDEIYIDLFRLYASSKGANVGFKRLISQIDAAKSLGFNRISIWAYGDISLFPIWDGYIIWGKYGFSMFEKSEITDFNLKMTTDRLM